MELCFLGTGGSWPTAERNVSAFALRPPGREIILFDCGEGTQRQFMRSTFSFMKVKHIFLTHLHADHIAGLPGLFQTMGLYNRVEPIWIYGPRGSVDTLSHLFNIPYFRPKFPVEMVELQDGSVVRMERGMVVARETLHTVPSLAYGYIEKERPGYFDREAAENLGVPPGPLYAQLQRGEPVLFGGKSVRPEDVMGPPRPGRKVVYSGDTAPISPVRELAQGADLLIHEATAADDQEDMARRYHHSTARDAARLAAEAHVHLLLLTHISPRYEDCSILLAQAREVFPNTVLAHDLMHVVVPYREKGFPYLIVDRKKVPLGLVHEGPDVRRQAGSL